MYRQYFLFRSDNIMCPPLACNHAGPSSGLSQTSHKSKVILYHEQIRPSRQYFKSQSSKLSARSGRPDRIHKIHKKLKYNFRYMGTIIEIQGMPVY